MADSYDLILRNGHVIDPANGIDEVRDLAVRDGRIALCAKDIPSDSADRVVDVTGSYVTPGLIDIHSHVYPLLPQGAANTLLTIDADTHMLRSGVTTTVDVGTVGWRDFLDFKERVVDVSHVRVLAMLNVASGGMVDMNTEQNPAELHPGITAAVARQYPDIVVGIKAAHYWVGRPFDEIHTPWASVDAGLEAAELAGLPFMIDFCPNHAKPGRSYEDLVTHKLRPGDIHTHVFAQQFPILDENRRVRPSWAARERAALRCRPWRRQLLVQKRKARL